MTDPASYCLGIEFLGECSYKPAAPYSVYFSLGEAISALAFTVAVQQLLKPIFHLRLQARFLSAARLYVSVFVGAFLILISTLIPHFPMLHNGPWGYPVVWEVVAALIFGGAYGIVIGTALKPARATPRTMVRFCQASARLLSSAAEGDHVDYIPDLVRSAPALIKASQILRRQPSDVTAFWEFVHRTEIQRGSYAWNLLRLLADPHFCRTLVRRSPWAVAELMREIDAQRLHSPAAEQFVREIAYQAIFDDDSMMVREVEYTGFATAPILSSSIFKSQFIVEQYDPFEWVFSGDRGLTQSTLKRFHTAVKTAVEITIAESTFQPVRALFSIQHYYEALSYQLDALRQSSQGDFGLVIQAGNCFTLAVKLARQVERDAAPDLYSDFFIRVQEETWRNDIISCFAEIVFKGICGIANKFEGYGDVYWSLSLDLFREAFPMSSGEHNGMTPFQQRLALLLLRKVRDNMNGSYPAVTRVLLACVGPYGAAPRPPNRSAFNILRDSFYAELKSLRVLVVREPAKINDYLPPNVTYDAAADKLMHTYSNGGAASTSLCDLNYLVPLDLTHSTNLNLNQPVPDER